MSYRATAFLLPLAFLFAVPASASENPPTITSGSFASPHVKIAWRGPDSYDAFNIRYSPGTLGALPTWQTQVAGGTGGSFTWLPPSPGTYAFIVEGCRKDSLGVFRSDCSKWSSQVQVNAPAEPPPQVNTLNWGPLSSGDCQMQNASVTFTSYGGGTFAALVKTNHTHGGDVWHATISAQNGNGQTVVGLGTFDSTRMDDDHGWYGWTVPFTYDQAQYPNISRVNMHHSC